MGPVLEVDIDALNVDGRRLESLGEPLAPSNCAPPGSDPVSLGAARSLNAHESALIEVLDYAALVRQYGGAVIRSAAVAFERADRAGAESIRRVDDTDAPPIGSPSAPLDMPALPPKPRQPPIQSIPELPALPSIGGEQFSVDLHSGPGSGDLRDFSRAWHHHGQDITRMSDDTAAVFVAVSEHWSSGHNAANRISGHATWLDSAAGWAERLSVGAEAVAHAFDVARQGTPTPDEFSAAGSNVEKAALVAKEAAERYYASVGDALSAIGHPIVPCPPIANSADIPDLSGSLPPGVPSDWVTRPADNGLGTVYQEPGATGNSNSIRIMEPSGDPRYPYGYVRFTNELNQPIDRDGKPGTRADTHIARNPDGSFPIPKGWP